MWCSARLGRLRGVFQIFCAAANILKHIRDWVLLIAGAAAAPRRGNVLQVRAEVKVAARARSGCSSRARCIYMENPNCRAGAAARTVLVSGCVGVKVSDRTRRMLGMEEGEVGEVGGGGGRG